jgi:hypothetical protein
MQLVQLQSASAKFKEQGLGLAAISYDSEAILKDFAQRHGIEFTLLADPNSEIIKRYGVLNTEAPPGFTKGMAHPGYFFVTPDGVIREQFFKDGYTERYTPNNLLQKLFPELVEGESRKVSAPHVELALSQSDRVVIPGNRLTLAIDVSLPPETHVYAPGVTGYKPIQFQLNSTPDLKVEDAQYPQAQTLFLPAIKESVPVYEGRFRIRQDVSVAANGKMIKAIGNGKTMTLTGTLHYQACDQTTCFLPQQTEVSWEIQLVPLDVERAPVAIQHK